MIRGSMQVHDAVSAWECSSIELSPTTANRDTISNLHPFSPFVPEGNQFDILNSPPNSSEVGKSAKKSYCGVSIREMLVRVWLQGSCRRWRSSYLWVSERKKR